MHYVLSVLIAVFALSACGPNEADSAGSNEARGTKSVPSTSEAGAQNPETSADALGDEAVANNDFAVDEPLPPFDEGFDGPPAIVANGEFEGVAPVTAIGQVQLYAIPDGTYLLRLENLRVTGGSDLQLRLMSGARSLKLGVLKGSSGNQNYLVEPSPVKTFTALEIHSGDGNSAAVARAALAR